MSMISKQIEELRSYAKARKGELANLINDAADTIEMLSEKLRASNMERSSQYYNDVWIPCSPETMPKKTNYYLVQYTRKYCRNEMAVAFYSVEEARCDDDYTWEIEIFSDIKEVIAWMPLPKPYEERREDKRKT